MEVFNQIYETFFSKLEREMPSYYSYHTPEHTRYVIDKSVLVGKKEKIKEDDLELLKIAALFHDMGFLESRDNHEELSCDMVMKELPSWNFKSNEIAKICGMIRATKIPQRPKTLLEKILADADLEYLGTDLYEEGSSRLYRELIYFNPSLTEKEWLEIQVNFLTAHQYHTEFCIKNRESQKQSHLKRLKSRLVEL
jgi:uncharacterized protein